MVGGAIAAAHPLLPAPLQALEAATGLLYLHRRTPQVRACTVAARWHECTCGCSV